VCDHACTPVCVEQGVITLTVNNEFQMKLGITSDELTSPWVLYKIEVFVRDSEEPGQHAVETNDRLITVF
jgi:hypothetical protein